MLIVNEKKIVDVIQRHGAAARELQAWLSEARMARWRSPRDISKHYPSAQFASSSVVVFDIGPNSYDLKVKINYGTLTVFIQSVV